jgi:tight adherence protein B
VRLAGPIAVVVAAFAALVPGALAQQGQAQAPKATLTEAQDSAFPDRVYLYRTPVQTNLTRLELTENGGPVTGLSVDSGSESSGAVLLIDASNSMAGEPIEAAMAAARAFLAQRKDDLPVAIIAYNPEITVLTPFTESSAELSAAVEEAPQTAEGTRIYDALIKAAELAKEEGYARTTAVLLSDGHRRGVQATLDETLTALSEANVRVISVGLQSSQYDPETLQSVSNATGGTYVESATPEQLEPIFTAIGQQLSNEYVVSYRSLLPPNVKATVTAVSPGFAPASATYTTPPLDLSPRGTFEETFVDDVITSPWLMLFVVVSVLALLAFAIFTAIDVRNRSLRRRMAQYVSVPSEEESRLRRAEVASMLADTAHSAVKGQRWWQRFETDVELGKFSLSPLAIAGWTIVGGILASIVCALLFQSLWGLLIGLLAPFATRWYVSRRVSKMRRAFEEQLADNLDVLAGAMRTGHSTMGALAVMADSSIEPSKTEFRRVLQDEQLGVPLDDALMVMARRMNSYDAEQLGLVMKLQREAGGNTAEVLDRVAEVIRGRMELRRLVDVLTAQARISRWILTGLPIFVLVSLAFTGGDYLDPMLNSLAGRIGLVVGAIMVLIGSFWIKRIAKLDV